MPPPQWVNKLPLGPEWLKKHKFINILVICTNNFGMTVFFSKVVYHFEIDLTVLHV